MSAAAAADRTARAGQARPIMKPVRIGPSVGAPNQVVSAITATPNTRLMVARLAA
jgi:hypothetical protein